MGGKAGMLRIWSETMIGHEAEHRYTGYLCSPPLWV